jgi:uncharacterized protein (UPF0548 family)
VTFTFDEAIVFLLPKPSAEKIARFISSQQGSPFSYGEVGATRTQLPTAYTVDRNRRKLGEGAEVFERSVAALKSWKQFDLGWVRAVPTETPIKVGSIVAILTHHFGFWSLNACRVVYVIDDEQPVKRFGFAYGTLADHVETGEERFMIEWHRDTDEVWYEILAFSRPHNFFVKLGVPLARMLQKRFARDSMAAMSRI